MLKEINEEQARGKGNDDGRIRNNCTNTQKRKWSLVVNALDLPKVNDAQIKDIGYLKSYQSIMDHPRECISNCLYYDT